MADIQTEYRGHKIVFGDNTEEWTCWDIQYTHAKLSTVKARIDKVYREQRSKLSVPCFEIKSMSVGSYDEKDCCIDALIVEYVGETDKSYHQVNGVNDHNVQVMAHRKFNTKTTREGKRISDLMPDTEEARAAWADYVMKSHEAKAAEKRAREAFSNLPRVTLDMIAELKAHKEKGDQV
jgi:hypothetical protein